MRYVPFVYMIPKSVPNAIYDGDEMLVMQAQLGEWDNLNHLIICKSTGKAAIVDPFSGTYWMDVCERHGFSLEFALLTHSHWDHTRGVEEISKEVPNARIRCWVLNLEWGSFHFRPVPQGHQRPLIFRTFQFHLQFHEFATQCHISAK